MKRTTALLALVALLVIVSVTQAAATPALLSWQFSGGGGYKASGNLAVFGNIVVWPTSGYQHYSHAYLPMVLRH